jgi:hypothetical protein
MISAPDDIMRLQEARLMKRNLKVLGIGLAKQIFHVVGMDDTGTIVLLKRLSRGALRLCRKFQFWGQNPKTKHRQFNDLQTTKLSKKQICDRACITTMSGERRDNTGANLPVDGCDGFSGPTDGHDSQENGSPAALMCVFTVRAVVVESIFRRGGKLTC